MRKTKVKLFKKYAVATLSVFFMTVGFACAQSWDEFKTQVGTGSATLENNVTADSTLIPPVPSATINGGNNTISGAGYNGSIIDNNGSNLIINNTNVESGNIPSVYAAGMDLGGAAIKNQSGTLTINNGTFSANSAPNGGAINNSGTGTVKITGATFQNNTVNVDLGTTTNFGGAVVNNSSASGISMAIEDAVFSGNSAGQSGSVNAGYGGAFHNNKGHATIQNTTFDGNYAQNAGGAILNRDILDISGGTIENNNTDAEGGAIANGMSISGSDSDATLTINGTVIRNNSAITSGGAILNRYSDVAVGNDTIHTVNINQGTVFEGNKSGVGGAIDNQGANATDTKDAVLNINGATFKGNYASNKGSAIRNAGIATITNTTFDGNGVSGSDIGQHGGAIYNEKMTFSSGAGATFVEGSSAGLVQISNSTFKNNAVAGHGGAIYNSSSVVIEDSDFYNNKAGDDTLQNGGAIYTTAQQSTGSVDSGDYVSGVPAITVVRAVNKDVNIGDSQSLSNKADSIVMNGFADDKVADTYYVATTSLQAADGKTLNINSEIHGSGTAADGTMLTHLNIGDEDKTYNGIVKVNGDASINTTNVNVYSGSLSFDHDAGLAATNVLNMYGGTLDLLNQEYGANQLRAKEFNLLGNSNIELDVDLAGETMNGIYKNNFDKVTNPGGNTLTVSEMYAWTDTNKDNVDILFSDAQALTGNKVLIGDNAKIIQSPTTKYAVTKYEKATGADPSNPDEMGVYFGFSRMGDSDPAISGPVAAQAAFLLMDNLYRQSFANMDMVTLMTPEQRMAWKMRNKYANAGYHRGVYAPNVLPEERDGLYLRPFSNFESVSLKNGPKVSNVSYGSLIGGESDIIDLGRGWDGNFSLFGAYHGSHQAYNGIDIWQNGGTFGGVATAYKGNFFTGLTANIGASAAEARHGFGNDQMPILMTGAAWKSGYNFGFNNNKFVLQPSYMMSYTFVNVFDYNSSSGARISQDPLHAIEIIPGLKLIGNFKNGWQPYAACNMTWNIMDKTKFYANEVALTQLSVKPYFEYGVGMQKRTGDRFTGYGQAMLRSGGRNGIALTLGLRWALGH